MSTLDATVSILEAMPADCEGKGLDMKDALNELGKHLCG